MALDASTAGLVGAGIGAAAGLGGALITELSAARRERRREKESAFLQILETLADSLQRAFMQIVNLDYVRESALEPPEVGIGGRAEALVAVHGTKQMLASLQTAEAAVSQCWRSVDGAVRAQLAALEVDGLDIDQISQLGRQKAAAHREALDLYGEARVAYAELVQRTREEL